MRATPSMPPEIAAKTNTLQPHRQVDRIAKSVSTWRPTPGGVRQLGRREGLCDQREVHRQIFEGDEPIGGLSDWNVLQRTIERRKGHALPFRRSEIQETPPTIA
jgi:hypothetical protein